MPNTTTPINLDLDFKLVKQLAIQEDKEGLQKLIDQGYCITELEGEFSAVGQLILEKNINAAEFLIEKFGASRNEAVKAAAMIGNTDYTFQLLYKGAGFDDAIQGALLGGNKALFWKLWGYRPDMSVAAYTAAKINDIETLAWLEKQNPPPSPVYIVKGAIEGGHTELEEKWLTHPEVTAEGVFYTLGSANKSETINDNLFHQLKRSQMVPTLYDFAAKGASYKNHRAFVFSLIKNAHAGLGYGVLGATTGGHVQLNNDLLQITPPAVQKDMLLTMIQGATTGGHLALLKKYLEKDKTGQGLEIALMIAIDANQTHIINAFADHMPSTYRVSKTMFNYKINLLPRKVDFIENSTLNLMSRNEVLIYLLSVDSRFRELVLPKILREKWPFSTANIGLQAQQIEHYLKNYGMTFPVALELTMTTHLNLHYWILHSYQIMKQYDLNRDLFKLITTYITSITFEDVTQLLDNFLKVTDNQLRRLPSYVPGKGITLFAPNNKNNVPTRQSVVRPMLMDKHDNPNNNNISKKRY
ncbi:MAG: hypothetical protein H0W64_05575 [Gammaproteobacteria bacterium]|nr:hypothetical protein [Gammaproteobacteria bacterium]